MTGHTGRTLKGVPRERKHLSRRVGGGKTGGVRCRVEGSIPVPRATHPRRTLGYDSVQFSGEKGETLGLDWGVGGGHKTGGLMGLVQRDTLLRTPYLPFSGCLWCLNGFPVLFLRPSSPLVKCYHELRQDNGGKY